MYTHARRISQTHRLKLYGNWPACRVGYIGVLRRCSAPIARDRRAPSERKRIPGTHTGYHSASLCRPKTRNCISDIYLNDFTGD